MSFLIRVEAISGEEIMHDETILVEDDVLYGFEKELVVLGQAATLKFTFDPPLGPKS